MEDKQELKETLDQLKQSNEQQARLAKWQCIFGGIAALCCLAVLLLVWSMMPRINDLASQLEVTLTNLEDITRQLASADLEGMVDNVDALVTTGQSSVELIIEKLNTMDFDTLNRAIQNLADVVEPLANFFNIFN